MSTRSQSLISSISEAIVSYLTFESKCGGGEVYCEQMLYGPIMRVAAHLNWRVHCEVAVSRTEKSTPGDHRRIDFMFVDKTNDNVVVGLEVKFEKKRKKRQSRSVQIDNDLKKLEIFKAEQKRQPKRKVETFILIIGRASITPTKCTGNPKAAISRHPFTLMEGGKKKLGALTNKQVDVFFKTSNTHFVASRVKV